MKIRYPHVIISLALLLSILVGIGFYMTRDGVSSGACGWGWGEKQMDEQIRALKREFKPLAPLSLEMKRFHCEGFQDLEVFADFEISQPDSTKLIEALEAIYVNPPQSQKFVGMRVKRLVTGYPQKQRFLYELPGFGSLHVHKFVIWVPTYQSSPVSVQFEGGQF